MKELANSIAQLAAIIMILITLAISTAAFAQWASASDGGAAKSDATTQQQLLADSR